MNILYTFLNFNGFTGSELYYYELAREMVNLGHKITIASNCGGQIKLMAEKKGIRCIHFSELNDLSDFHVIHCSHRSVVKPLLTNYIKSESKIKRHIPVVCTVHSEILSEEFIPDFLTGFIDYFISIRPSILNDTLKAISSQKKTLLYNPIDFSRYNTDNTSDEVTIFFPGTINKLRFPVLCELVKTFPDYRIICMGGNDYSHIKIKGVEYISPNFRTEVLFKKCSMSAGIIQGRTYIESMLCGKPHLDYAVNEKGDISDLKLYHAPGDYILFGGNWVHKSQFESSNVAQRIELIYRSLI